jgi:hypothetical protein
VLKYQHEAPLLGALQYKSVVVIPLCYLVLVHHINILSARIEAQASTSSSQASMSRRLLAYILVLLQATRAAPSLQLDQKFSIHG